MSLAEDALVVATLVVIEAVLSFDNAAILAIISRRLPAGAERSRALNVGLLLAYALRVIAIASVVFLLKFPVFFVIGGAYLVFLFARHVWHRLARRSGGHHAPGAAKGAFGMSAFAYTIAQIAVVDLVFALDQVVGGVGFTHTAWLIMVAAAIGLVFLRILAPVMARLMDWLPTLEDAAFVAVGFVGVLLVLENPPFTDWMYDPPTWQKVAITLGIFVVPVFVKLVFGVPRTEAPADAPPTDKPS